MTLKEALKQTKNILSNINIPASMLKQIGVPIVNAIDNLDACINSIPDIAETKEEADESEA